MPTLVWTRARPGKYTCYAHGYIITRLPLHRPLWRLCYIVDRELRLSELLLSDTLAACKDHAQRHDDAKQPPPPPLA